MYEVQSDIKTPLEKGTYTLTCDGMTADYDAKTVTFTSGGVKNVSLTAPDGIGNSSIIINDENDTVSVKGDIEFTSDFTASDALSTYYTASGNAYSITTDADGNQCLTTAASNTADTLLFGPALSDYTFEMDFVPTNLSGAGVNTIAVGMRAKTSNDRSAYRIAVAERAKFDYTNLSYNRLAAGRSKSSNAAEWYYADYSDAPFIQ